MFQIHIKKTRELFAAATAMGAIGLLTVATAQAAPLAPLPLAPACDQYAFNGRFVADGSPPDVERAPWQVFFTSTGQSAGAPPAAVTFTDGGQVKGRLIGGRIEGRSIHFQIKWDDKPDNVWSFWGTIDDTGLASGAEDGPGSGAHWSSSTPLACATPAPVQPPAPPQKRTATVTSDVDVYNIAADDVPDASGVVGQRIGVLRAGQQVEVGEPCNPNDWCKVLSSDLPGGLGFVLRNLQF